jgi:GDP-D-mannose 3',5'-epimerase
VPVAGHARRTEQRAAAYGEDVTRIVVTGAAGFIGGHLVRYLKSLGHQVRAVDVRASGTDESVQADLRDPAECRAVLTGADEVHALAADMGGIGYLAAHDARLTRNNLLIDLNTVEAARQAGVGRLLFTSSACVYPVGRQADVFATPLSEEDAYPAQPAEGYGWAKLMTEQLCARYAAAYGQQYRIARLHNVYGPDGAWRGGREKSPAAICRKVATAKLTGAGTVEIWGDGQQTRSYCYVSDCVEGLVRIMGSDHAEPLNLGHPHAVTIDGLVDLVSEIAGVVLEKRHVPGPQGVRGRNCDLRRLVEVTGWQPVVGLRDGLARTYEWVEARVRESL